MAAHNKPKIDRVMQNKIGQELRAMYEELLKQPLPEKLTAPLRTLDEVQSSNQGLTEAIDPMRHQTTTDPEKHQILKRA
jgi:Anti-sigma factor NepR